jgi:hypothetical protein
MFPVTPGFVPIPIDPDVNLHVQSKPSGIRD